MTTACSQMTDLHQVLLIYCPGIHSTRKTTLQAGTCQKHGAKERFCCSYQRFGVLARRSQERLYAGGSFLLYGVPPLRSEAFVGLGSGRYGQELWGNWEKTKWSAKIQLKTNQRVNDMFLLDCKFCIFHDGSYSFCP